MSDAPQRPEFPAHGGTAEDVLQSMRDAKRQDVDWRAGATNFYVQFGGDDVLDVACQASTLYLLESAHGGRAFPSVLAYERDLIDWSLDLLGAPACACGCLTSGGNESIFVTLLAARDQARAQANETAGDEIIVPTSAHPAFEKAAHLLDLKILRVPIGKDFRADTAMMRAAITARTLMLVGSAPQFPHGVFDPIVELGWLAIDAGLWLHVDASVGGFIVPFAHALGHAVPAFDLSVPGVTSLSADLHKYGCAPKGASIALFADPAAASHLQFNFAEWPFRPYRSAPLAGTRAAAPIAAAWAVMRSLGRDGYLRITREVLALSQTLARGIEAIPGLHLVAPLELSVIAYTADHLEIGDIAAGLERRGWFVNWGGAPAAIHTGMVTLSQAAGLDRYLTDLRAVVAELETT